MANEQIFDDEILSDEELDGVAGGNSIDRGIATLWVKRYYGSNGTHGQIVDTSGGFTPNSTMANFCAKAGIDYQMNEEGLDQFKIDGEWRDAVWLASNKDFALDYFDKKLGIK